MKLDQEIMQSADAMKDEMIARRRDLHRHPEPGWTEFRTAALVATTLESLGYDVAAGEDAVARTSMMGLPSPEILRAAEERAAAEGAEPRWLERMKGGLTGVVGTLRFTKPGPVVALRFDMDSNDVDETDAPDHLPNREGFASGHAGAMHACGHDGHTTVGLAVAKLLAERKDALAGTLKLIFQPAEEGVRGAKAMTDRGVVDDADYMLGAHFGFKMKETGSIVCNVTGFLATGKYDARFTGRASHAGAAPEAGRNALLAAACAALNLHAIPRHSGGASRINVGVLEAGTGRNVTADKALLKLETRGATSAINEFMETEAKRVIEAAAAMYGVEVSVEKVGGAAGGSNTPELAAFVAKRANELGVFSKIVNDCDFGASEDFAYFMERVQSHGGQAAYLMVGADLAAGHHDSHFNFDENALPNAAKILACTAASLLLGEKP